MKGTLGPGHDSTQTRSYRESSLLKQQGPHHSPPSNLDIPGTGQNPSKGRQLSHDLGVPQRSSHEPAGRVGRTPERPGRQLTSHTSTQRFQAEKPCGRLLQPYKSKAARWPEHGRSVPKGSMCRNTWLPSASMLGSAGTFGRRAHHKVTRPWRPSLQPSARSNVDLKKGLLEKNRWLLTSPSSCLTMGSLSHIPSMMPPTMKPNKWGHLI